MTEKQEKALWILDKLNFIVYTILIFCLGVLITLYYIDYKIAREGVFYAKDWNCMMELEEDME